MTDIKIKRYADKENLKKLVKYSKDTFANKSEINEKFYTKEQIYTKSEIDTKLNSKANTSDLSTVATTGSYNDLLDKPTSFDVYLDNYYTKSEIDNLLSNIGSGTGGSDDASGGFSFYDAVERAPGYDGTSQINIVEDSNTVEDE